MLKTERMYAGYGRVPVVNDISLTVSPGEMLAVFGANGAGKTTLLKAIAGFVKPSSGLVTVNDSPCSTARMISALSLRSSRWLIVLTSES